MAMLVSFLWLYLHGYAAILSGILSHIVSSEKVSEYFVFFQPYQKFCLLRHFFYFYPSGMFSTLLLILYLHI